MTRYDIHSGCFIFLDKIESFSFIYIYGVDKISGYVDLSKYDEGARYAWSDVEFAFIVNGVTIPLGEDFMTAKSHYDNINSLIKLELLEL
jgi:hypothetical protein